MVTGPPRAASTPDAVEHAGDETFRLLVSSVRDYAIFMLDPAGKVASWNPGAERIKGYRSEEIIGRHFSAFYPREDIEAGKCEMELRVAAETGRFEDEGWRLRKDGSRFWALVVITAMRDDAGTLIGFGKVTRDLSERKRAEDARVAAEERFRLLVESVQDYALFILDPDGNVASWNEGARRTKGYTSDEIIGRHFSVFYPTADVEAGKCARALKVAEREGHYEDEGWRVRKDGSRFWANVVISAVRDHAGTLVGYSKITRDLTDHKRSEEERAARLAAEQANRTKDEFLAILGHELRNPLSPILTALELMRLRGTAPTKEYEVIDRQVRHMKHLVDDLLDVSRIARGKVELQRSALDIRDVIARAVEVATPLLEQRRHRFKIEEADERMIVHGDEARLTQVLTNLLTNAAKYTPPGGNITVTVAREGAEIVIAVRDDGTGIDPELLPRVFDLFVQAAQTSDRSAGGLGLGLALVRSLVQLHGGRVEAHSAGTGRGSRFVVRLPARVSSSNPASSSTGRTPILARVANPARRILLVDDNEDARALLGDYLSAIGHDVQGVPDGASALQAVESFLPEIAILDIGLPVMDGYELATRLQHALRVAPPHLIALSGYGQQSDKQRSRDVGFREHLVKPVDLAALVTLLEALPA